MDQNRNEVSIEISNHSSLNKGNKLNPNKSIDQLKLNNSKIILVIRSPKLFHKETHFLSHFVGSSPSRGDIFF